MLRRWLLAVSVVVLLASGCGGDDDDTTAEVATTTTAAVGTTLADAAPSTSPTTTISEIEEPDATSTSTPDEATTTAPPAVAEAVLPISGWELVLNGTNLWAAELVALGDEFFVAGNESGPDVTPRSGVWRSTDGITWDESLVFPVVFGVAPRIDVVAISVADDHMEVLGRRTDGAPWPMADGKELVVFRTDDPGMSWSESVVHTWGAANHRELLSPTFAYQDPDLVFAVEGGAGEGGGDDTITGTMVWIRSGDGWEFVDPAASGLAQVWVWAIAATEDGYIALGDTRQPVEGFADCQTQALWTSPDGRSWTRVWTNDRDCEWFGVHDFLTIDGELLAIANENDVISCAVNDDGKWECPPLYAPVRVFRVTDTEIEDVTVEPAEFTDLFVTDVDIEGDIIAVIGRTFDATEGRVWFSTDARTWSPIDLPGSELVDKDLFQVATNADGTTIILGTEITPTGPANFQTWINTAP